MNTKSMTPHYDPNRGCPVVAMFNQGFLVFSYKTGALTTIIEKLGTISSKR